VQSTDNICYSTIKSKNSIFVQNPIMNVRKISISIFLWLISFILLGQNLPTKSKRAEKYFIEARKEYTLGNSVQAELLLKKTIKIDKNFLAAYFLTATIKEELGYPLAAIEYYKKGLAINPDAAPTGYYYLAKVYLSQGMYTEAQVTFTKCLSFINISPRVRKESEFQLKNCLFALKTIQNPLAFKLKNLGVNINTKESEYFPTLTVDNQFLLFTRRISSQKKYVQEDFFGADKLNDSLWQESFSMVELNTPFNEGAASLSADGKTLVFTACENYGEYGDERKGYGSCDLFFARKIGNHWSKPINMGAPINTSNWESQPSLSANGKSLYFIRAKKKLQGHSDIYRSDLDENGFWKTPVKLNSNINTSKDELSVFIHPDNQTLYFSSKGHIGMGETDIYLSRWKEETQDWGEAINLGYPINTYKDENSILVSPDGNLAYFASDRPEGFGELDLYSFQLPKQLQPEKITYLKGKVFDAQTQEVLSAAFDLIDIETGKQLLNSDSDSSNGSFLLTLQLGKNYLLNVSLPGYLFYSDQFLLQNAFSNQKPFLKNIPLQPIGINQKVILKNIFFKTGQSELQNNSEIELGKLISFLNDNPKVHIEIQGHTDTIGTDEYNLNLSIERAKSVYNFLIEHEIPAERLSYKGLGYLQPVEENDTEEGRAQNRRTEFVVTQI